MLKKFTTTAALVAGLASASVFAQTFKADVSKSTIDWLGKKVTGQHNGAVKMLSGSLVLDKDAVKSGAFEADLNSITCSDLQGEWADKLIGHLKSEDFFSTAKFPKATLAITSGTKNADGSYLLKGNLTIKGITKPIEFPATIKTEGAALTAKATLVVDRTLYDIRYGSKSFFESIGDKAIDNDFTLTVNLVASK
jgi:polyisoprenoid-binding protein YceI